DVRRDHRDRLLLQGHVGIGRSRGRRPRRQRSRRDLVPRLRGVQLRLHADAASHPPADPHHQMNELLAMPRGWLEATGEMARFMGGVVADVWSMRVFRFFGETLRQAGILIVYSTLVIWGLVFITG